MRTNYKRCIIIPTRAARRSSEILHPNIPQEFAQKLKQVPLRPADNSNQLPNKFEDQPWSILCDFDGTISLVDVTDALLVSFALDGWQALEADWVDGKIGSQQCMAAQVTLIDASKAQLDARIAEIEIDAAFIEFVAAANDFGIPLSVVSDGLDYVIQSILRRHSITKLPIVANKLEQINDRRWRLDFPNARDDCRKSSGTCKCALLQQARKNGRVLFIGDGASDFCVSGQADFVLAKGPLIDYAIAEGISHAPINGFQDALIWLAANVRQKPLPARLACA